MTRMWRRYLLVGLLVVGVDIMLPVGLGRDLTSCLIAAAGAAAVAEGARRNRPEYPRGWYLLSIGIGCWAVGMVIFSWDRQSNAIGAFPSLADVAFLASYPLIAGALLMFARIRGCELRPAAPLDSVILTLSVGLLSWVFLVEPIWDAQGVPALTRLVALAYPLGNVLLFGALVRLANAPGPVRGASRLLASLAGVMLVVLSVLQAIASAPIINAHSWVLNPAWAVLSVLVGAAGLHPSTRVVSAGAATDEYTMRLGRIVALAAAAMVGPVILMAQLITGAPLDAWTCLIASALVMMLILVRVIRLVRTLQEQSQRLVQLADTDPLTGLPNRRALSAVVQSRLADRSRPCALMLLDLDKFKEVNDSLGHHVGDQLLVQVGTRLREHLRAGDVLARLGGDEFAVLLEDAGSEQAVVVTTALRAALAEPFTSEGVELRTSASVGIALFPDDGLDLSTLLRKADVAMYRAKATSHGHHLYRGIDDDSETTRLQSRAELRTALTGDQFVLHYQPKVDLSTGQVNSVEALVRWNHPSRGMLYPVAFLALIEDCGLMPTLTRVVLAKALDQAVVWDSRGEQLTVAVNLSASSLVDSDLPRQVASMLVGRGLSPHRLQLEITEEFFMKDRERARGILTRLRNNGVEISIDDYGTGYSSLSYLRDLPVDELKLDRSFIEPMTGDPRAAALVASTIDLAHSLGLRMVAEGVDTLVAYTELTRLGCDQAQGFFMSQPVPAAELDDWLSIRRAAAKPTDISRRRTLTSLG